MQRAQSLFDIPPELPDDFGGDPLTGSGFEFEESEPEYAISELTKPEHRAPAKE